MNICVTRAVFLADEDLVEPSFTGVLFVKVYSPVLDMVSVMGLVPSSMASLM